MAHCSPLLYRKWLSRKMRAVYLSRWTHFLPSFVEWFSLWIVSPYYQVADMPGYLRAVSTQRLCIAIIRQPDCIRRYSLCCLCHTWTRVCVSRGGAEQLCAWLRLIYSCAASYTVGSNFTVGCTVCYQCCNGDWLAPQHSTSSLPCASWVLVARCYTTGVSRW